MNNKITPRPPVKKSAKDFILEAEDRGKIKQEEKSHLLVPWKGRQVRNDVQKVFTVKLQEEYTLKIKYLSEITNKSQQKIVREIIQLGVDKALKESGV